MILRITSGPAKPATAQTDVAALREMLSEDQLVQFLGRFAGLRVYFPVREHNPKIAEAVGEKASLALHEHYGGSFVRIPLDRELRARHMRRQGKTNTEVALALGLTETGVDKLFRRLNHPARGKREGGGQ